ncbi:MAG: AarF/ABC1/UbiB kinase family protein, partial [Anaerolineales bacterium]|nr:AarF/ABC1/UbiB kinase family protein [Anaerolineales bacterium]
MPGNLRYLRIVWFFGRLILHIIGWELVLRRLGLGGLANRTGQARYVRWAGRFRVLAVRLGGVMIKVGQFLSARVDVLPEYITQELAGLQDEVPPAPFPAIQATVEAELGRPLAEAFPTFETAGVAAASLGQAHRARLPSGEAVVVKVLRPGIEAIVEIDLAALRLVAGWVKRYPPIGRRADVDGLLREFAATLREELDYRLEAEHAARFAALFADSPGVRIPHLYPAVSTQRVLTLEDVGFIKITDYAALEAAGIRRAEVARRLFKAYMIQIFDEGFFHADPHPGNLFVQPLGERPGWRLVFIDFGMTGVVTPSIRAALRSAAIGLALRDPSRLMRAAVDLGALRPGADLSRIMAAEQAVFDRFWGKSMQELRQIEPREVEQFMREFRDLLFELPFQVPENLIYLGRTVSILSGMCTALDPEFNVFGAITPFARELMEEELDGRNLD